MGPDAAVRKKPPVSTLEQTTANQERELRQVAERAGWQIVRVYKDHGISGAKGKDCRPSALVGQNDLIA